MGNIKELVDSIADIGLLHLIVISQDKTLVCGKRRIDALKLLGINDLIEGEHYRVVNIKDILKGERDENVIRKDFLPSEAVAIWEATESYQGQHLSESDRSEKPRRDRVAEYVGMGHTKLSNAKTIIDSGNQELIDKMDKTGNVNKYYRELKIQQIRQKKAELGEKITISDELIDFRFGDFKEVLVDIPDNSVDLILTDPPYGYDYIELWSDLSKFADRVLKPSKFCIAYTGRLHLPEVMNRMCEYLEYYWIFCLYLTGQTLIVHKVNIMERWKPTLIYQKKPFKKLEMPFSDMIEGSGREKDCHEWQQAESELKIIIETFSKPGDTILDPFTGSGTVLYASKKMKRKSIGAEMDFETYNIAKSRIMDDIQRQIKKEII